MTKKETSERTKAIHTLGFMIHDGQRPEREITTDAADASAS